MSKTDQARAFLTWELAVFCPNGSKKSHQFEGAYPERDLSLCFQSGEEQRSFTLSSYWVGHLQQHCYQHYLPALWEDVPHRLGVASGFLILPFTVVKTC